MAGVTRIQVTATLQYDDGYVVTIGTPLMKKDIRHGDFFSDDLTQQIIQNSGEMLAAIIDQKKLTGLYMQAKNHMKSREPKKPYDRFDPPFSVN